MRRRAVIAGCCLALGVSPGCAGFRARRERPEDGPASATARHELSQAATAAMDRGDLPGARADLERLVAQSPRSAELHYRLGKVLQLQGELPGAQACFRQALDLDKQYVGALIGLGQVAARLGRPEDALVHFETAIDVEPHQSEAHLARGQVLETLGRTDEALAAYFRSLELDKSSVAAILRVASIQLGRDQALQALVRLNVANEYAPEDAEVRHRRGLAHLALKHPKLALADLQFASDRMPDRPEVMLDLARAYEAAHQPEAARLLAQKALALQPDSAVARDMADRLRR